MKTIKEHLHEKHGHKFQDCNFGQTHFSYGKRDKKLIDEIIRTTTTTRKGGGKPPKGGGNPPPPPPPPPPVTGGVLFLDFDGGLVSNTSWNFAGDINCAYSGLTIEEQNIIIAAVMDDYAPYDVIVTTDEAVYNAAPANRRMRCYITETYEWYGNGAGGVSFVGSFTWGDNTPCFVFSSLLGYNTKYILEAVSHEFGHTLGLYHQSRYDANCVKLSDYNSGGCPDHCGEAPIMGVAYYQPVSRWWIGPNSYGCDQIQDDNAIISKLLGLKTV